MVSCDGTWSTRDRPTPTNVVALHERVLAVDGTGVRQLAHYLPGVGTRIGEVLGGAVFGLGLSRTVRDAYRFLVERYEPGDEIYLFGFSRGAYTARAVAGMIRNAGLLRREEADRVEDAYRLYRSRRPQDAPDGAAATAFRERWSREAPVRCVGVWDTVGALGIPLSGVPVVRRLNRRWAFHDTELSSTVEAGFQALAVDERRRLFVPAVWQPRRTGSGQRVEQLWFAGSHSDVGGGYPDRDLAELTLWWMADRARSCGLALAGPQERSPAWSLGRLHESRRLVFRLLPARVRGLGRVDPDRERLAESVQERRRDLGSYDPANVRSYLAGGGRVADL